MTIEIMWLGHASVMIKGGSHTLYIDPWKIVGTLPKADIILITHDHYDHYSEQDIRSLSKDSTRVVAPMATPLVTDVVHPGGKLSLSGVSIEAKPAYNIEKAFHPKEKGWVGYVVGLEGMRIYHAGDTDRIPEMGGFSVDAVLIPVGGTYTMDACEAAQAVEDVQAGIVIPIHFGDIVGSRKDAEMLAKATKRTVHILAPHESHTIT